MTACSSWIRYLHFEVAGLVVFDRGNLALAWVSAPSSAQRAPRVPRG